jgi:hypothetical protein
MLRVWRPVLAEQARRILPAVVDAEDPDEERARRHASPTATGAVTIGSNNSSHAIHKPTGYLLLNKRTRYSLLSLAE